LGDAAGTVFWSGTPQIPLGDAFGDAAGDALKRSELESASHLQRMKAISEPESASY
jgi:hypothetical protein